MKSDQLLKTLPRSRRSGVKTNNNKVPMVNPELLANITSHGINLADTGIDVLRLKGCESKKLFSLGISNLEQLANTSESSLRIIPHFGIMKVRRLKTRLNSYLQTLMEGINPPVDIQPLIQDEDPPAVPAGEDDSQLSSAFEFISELEAATQSLDRLKKRMHLYVAELRKNQS